MKNVRKIIFIALIVLVGISLLSTILTGIFGGSNSETETSQESQAAPAQNTAAAPPAPKPRPEDDPAYTGPWSIRTFVDEFGDKTEDQYVALVTEGTFSNSATNNEKCRVLFLITRDSFCVEIYEDYYGIENDVANTFILFNPANVTIRDKNGTDHRLRGNTLGSSGQRLYITPFNDVISVIKQGGLVRFSISEGGSSYRFDIPNTDFFDRAFEQIGG
jgi:hypothetical protein